MKNIKEYIVTRYYVYDLTSERFHFNKPQIASSMNYRIEYSNIET